VPLPAFFLPAKSINTAVVVITADLSKPWAVLEDICKWLQRTRSALEEQYQLLEKRGSPLPAQLKVQNSCGHDMGQI
jgi:prophage antirepressor-like protein